MWMRMPAPPQEGWEVSVGTMADVPHDTNDFVVATDGSGGEHGSNPLLRRVGYGVAVLRIGNAIEDCQLVFGLAGAVPGRQMVPRAELHAMARAQEAVDRERAHSASESLNLVRALQSTLAGTVDKRGAVNFDIWEGLKKTRSGCSGSAPRLKGTPTQRNSRRTSSKTRVWTGASCTPPWLATSLRTPWQEWRRRGFK